MQRIFMSQSCKDDVPEESSPYAELIHVTEKTPNGGGCFMILVNQILSHILWRRWAHFHRCPGLPGFFSCLGGGGSGCISTSSSSLQNLALTLNQCWWKALLWAAAFLRKSACRAEAMTSAPVVMTHDLLLGVMGRLTPSAILCRL